MSTGECVRVTVNGQLSLVLPQTADDLGIADGQELSEDEFRLVVYHNLAWLRTFKAIDKAQLNSS